MIMKPEWLEGERSSLAYSVLERKKEYDRLCFAAEDSRKLALKNNYWTAFYSLASIVSAFASGSLVSAAYQHFSNGLESGNIDRYAAGSSCALLALGLTSASLAYLFSSMRKTDKHDKDAKEAEKRREKLRPEIEEIISKYLG